MYIKRYLSFIYLYIYLSSSYWCSLYKDIEPRTNVKYTNIIEKIRAIIKVIEFYLRKKILDNINIYL
jgi:hypothetical protein